MFIVVGSDDDATYVVTWIGGSVRSLPTKECRAVLDGYYPTERGVEFHSTQVKNIPLCRVTFEDTIQARQVERINFSSVVCAGGVESFADDVTETPHIRVDALVPNVKRWVPPEHVDVVGKFVMDEHGTILKVERQVGLYVEGQGAVGPVTAYNWTRTQVKEQIAADGTPVWRNDPTTEQPHPDEILTALVFGKLLVWVDSRWVDVSRTHFGVTSFSDTALFAVRNEDRGPNLERLVERITRGSVYVYHSRDDYKASRKSPDRQVTGVSKFSEDEYHLHFRGNTYYDFHQTRRFYGHIVIEPSKSEMKWYENLSDSR
jgi:hypothetical protein